MKYKVSNCPSFVLMRTATSGTYFDMCGNAKGHIKCADCTDCIIKQVIEKCKKRSGKCERCKASEDYQPTDCLDYCSNDDVIFAEQILQLFDIEEIK